MPHSALGDTLRSSELLRWLLAELLLSGLSKLLWCAGRWLCSNIGSLSQSVRK